MNVTPIMEDAVKTVTTFLDSFPVPVTLVTHWLLMQSHAMVWQSIYSYKATINKSTDMKIKNTGLYMQPIHILIYICICIDVRICAIMYGIKIP